MLAIHLLTISPPFSYSSLFFISFYSTNLTNEPYTHFRLSISKLDQQTSSRYNNNNIFRVGEKIEMFAIAARFRQDKRGEIFEKGGEEGAARGEGFKTCWFRCNDATRTLRPLPVVGRQVKYRRRSLISAAAHDFFVNGGMPAELHSHIDRTDRAAVLTHAR